MAGELIVRVIYPLTTGRIILRTDRNWEQDVEPESVSPDGTQTQFRLTLDRPYCYFKACLRDGSALFWSQGTNYLGTTNVPGGKDIYPFFHGNLTGTFTDRLEVPGSSPGNSHPIRVYQPPGYSENTLKRYPVLYMHDGKNLFFPREAFGGQPWAVNATMDLLDSMNVIDKVFVVGIDTDDRMTDYTKPGYERYGRYIVELLKPFVDSKFRTLSSPQTTAVMGSSLGGVVSFYLAWQWPDVFGKAACLSSTFGFRDDLLSRVRGEEARGQFYLDSGWPGDNYEATVAMRDALRERGYRAGEDLLYFAFPNALHDETHWALRSHIPFQFFFGKQFARD
ncbi:MAG TPA: alpha/beta hydrolase-fold protein [Chloroflexia bacterium]|jgi:pimeloyl-ACP methyl ester carboxylesterase